MSGRSRDDDSADGSDASDASDATYSLQSVRNALRILLVLQQGQEMSVSDVAKQLGVGMSTAHRLLATLKLESFVRQSRTSRKYSLGPVMSVTSSARMIDDLVHAAREPMRRLVELTGETSNLAIRDGRVVRYIYIVESPHIVRLSFRLEDTHPVHTLAAGKVLLAHLAPVELNRLFPKEEIPQRTPHTIASRQRLHEELAEVKANGYALNHSEVELGLFAAAAPVLDSNGMAVAAISLGGPQYRIHEGNVREIVSKGKSRLDLLLDAARQTSADLESGSREEAPVP